MGMEIAIAGRSKRKRSKEKESEVESRDDSRREEEKPEQNRYVEVEDNSVKLSCDQGVLTGTK